MHLILFIPLSSLHLDPSFCRKLHLKSPLEGPRSVARPDRRHPPDFASRYRLITAEYSLRARVRPEKPLFIGGLGKVSQEVLLFSS